MMEDFSGESQSEKAAKLKENAFASALIAHNATGSTGGRANEKIKNYLNGNPTLVASVLSKMSSKEERKGILMDVGFPTSDAILKNLISEDMEGAGSGLAAQVIANLPGSGAANMSNVLDAAQNSLVIILMEMPIKLWNF